MEIGKENVGWKEVSRHDLLVLGADGTAPENQGDGGRSLWAGVAGAASVQKPS